MRRTWLLVSLLLGVCSVATGQDAASGIKVGSPAPDFTMTGIDGKDFKLSELTKQGKHVVLIFDRAHW